MSAHAFSFRVHEPAVTLKAVDAQSACANAHRAARQLALRHGLAADYLPLDGDTFLALDLQPHAAGTIESKLADGSSVTDLA